VRCFRKVTVILTGMLLLVMSTALVSEASENGIEILKNRCVSCHALQGPAASTLASLWQRKGPDLFYAGNKYNQTWVETWLQNPKRIRPAGMFYMDHVKSGPKWDLVDKSTLTGHIKLNAAEAKTVAAALAGLKTNSALIKAETHDPDIDASSMGEMMFDKIYGCAACHQTEPGYGGMSGAEIYTAGKRLTAEFMLSYIRSPQAWDPKIWMPNKHVPESNVQLLVNYIIDLSKENFDD